ncbi:MAG: glycosyltransferase, partial [Myxococcales bacterium]|nr:glycosyltransferase [Polyangiaceae bacterium]MDW8250811.1 glycosyltransferase [Myxococcales bacterium]
MVTSLVGGTRDFIEHGTNALVAEQPEDWYTHIKLLLNEIPLRAQLAQAGRKLIEERYCLEAQGSIFAEHIRSAVSGS